MPPSAAGCTLLSVRVLEAASRTAKAVNLIGYSKGFTDPLHILANYPDTHQAVKSLIRYTDIVGGTSLATNVSRWVGNVLQIVPLPGESMGDARANRLKGGG
ncbi:MAG: triacylglycerol esterase/lipase EstA (alpha/beta hydrolase family) [Gammaproteobacteria bacterium]